MHAYLYSSLDIDPSPYTFAIIPETSVGIDKIREAQKFASTLPPKDQINKIIIYQAEKMTIEAQNAFLKTLEEPPVQCEIYLVTNFPDQLLPTVLSRVENKIQKKSYASATLEDSRKIWQKLQNKSVGESLAVIDEQSFTREIFLHFLNDLEFILHSQLDNLPQLTKLYELLYTTRKFIQSNCNLRLVQDYFVTHLVLE